MADSGGSWVTRPLSRPVPPAIVDAMHDLQMKTVLDRLCANRSPAQLTNDPLSFCHRYGDPADREVAAVIASSFAYGAVGIILRSLESVFARLGPSPRRYVERFDPARGVRDFAGFKHRFNDGRDLCALLWGMRLMLQESGSVEAFFLRGHDRDAPDVTESLNRYCAAVLALDYWPVFGRHDMPRDSSFPFLFPAPRSGSACKRLCMFLRWVARPDDGIDLGLWPGLSPSQLIIPVDTHIRRIGRYLGFTGRNSADWRTAREITAALRRFDPDDPIRYDFALAHLGISQGCTGTDPVVCASCPIAAICTGKSVIPSRRKGV